MIRPWRSRGFSLVELMITIALLAVLTMIAAPSLSDFIKRNTVTSQTNELLGVLQFARSTAITRNVMVSVCPSATASSATPTCSGTKTYDTGWLVYTSTTASTVYGSTNELLRVFQGANNASVQSSTPVVTFDARGSSVSGAIAFLVCAKANAATVGQSGPRSSGRRVDLQSGGRSASSVLATSTTPSAAQTLCTAS